MDLTKIREPFGLLDRETQLALKDHGGPYQLYNCEGVWQTMTEAEPSWILTHVYRVKPEPPKPREFWISDPKLRWAVRHYYSQEEALAAGLSLETVIHVREVLE